MRLIGCRSNYSEIEIHSSLSLKPQNPKQLALQPFQRGCTLSVPHNQRDVNSVHVK